MCRKQWDKYLENGSPVYCKYCPSAKKKIKKNTKLLFLVIIAQMKRTATDFLKSVGKWKMKCKFAHYFKYTRWFDSCRQSINTEYCASFCFFTEPI